VAFDLSFGLKGNWQRKTVKLAMKQQIAEYGPKSAKERFAYAEPHRSYDLSLTLTMGCTAVGSGASSHKLLLIGFTPFRRRLTG
jgi:hypothetical protein